MHNKSKRDCDFDKFAFSTYFQTKSKIVPVVVSRHNFACDVVFFCRTEFWIFTMSRKLRVETERLQQLKDEEKEEEDKLNLIRKRMYAPIVWTRLTSGFQIVDVQEQYFPVVLDMIKVKM